LKKRDEIMSVQVIRAARTQDWRSRLVLGLSGLLLFETVTGLAVYLAPFSVANQIAVLLHTLVGVPLVLPATWYVVSHFLAYRQHPLTHYKLTGYVAAAAMALLAVSGFILTWEALLGTRISYLWRTMHIVGTFVLLGFLTPHIVLLLLRAWRTASGWARGGPVRVYCVRTVLVALGFCALWAAWSAVERPPTFDNAFPADYSTPYGKNRPFAPSLAKTSTGGAFDPDSLSGSEACGSSGCHKQIYEEWLPSAHHYSSMDPPFQAIQTAMGKQNGAESTRYCGGCHDPISLFSGTKNLFVENLSNLHGYQEGVSCLVCHSIKETDVKGNANYTIVQPARYLHELSRTRLGRLASDFLVRAYPAEHVNTYSRRMFKTPEFCAACHKQFIDQEVNNVGWVQLQNQYDNWRKSRWNHPGEPQKTIECRECHMPLLASGDPASGDSLDYNRSASDGKHRSHRFLGANQWIPALLKLPGGEEQTRDVEQWLRGEYPIPEIAGKWTQGPAVPIELSVPESVKPGQPVEVRVVITSNKVGHDFPTGPLDIIQAWVDIEVRDAEDKVVYASGKVDEKHFIEPGTFMFKAEPVDQYGNLIDRHNLWEMVGVRYRRSLFPGFADTAVYNFNCPSTAAADVRGTSAPREEQFTFQSPQSQTAYLTVHATLRYRKVDQYLLNFALGEDKGLTAPISVLSEAKSTIQVLDTSAQRPAKLEGRRVAPS
jgi:cytochrome c554/c'-like protein